MHWVKKSSPSGNLDSRRETRAGKGKHLDDSSSVCTVAPISSSVPPPLLLDGGAMANFPIDPHRFLPPSFGILETWGVDGHPARLYVIASSTSSHRHESWAIAQDVPRPEDEEIDEVLKQVHDHIVGNLQWNVVSFVESAIGLGLFCMRDIATRDLLVAQPPHHLGQGFMVNFVHHDEGENFRATVYTRLSWLMFLNIPMDYRNEEFLRESVAKFGKMHGWIREYPEPAHTLVHCTYGGTADVPRSMVIREPRQFGGQVVSWYVLVYILTSEPVDLLPGDESPEPANGNPHPQSFVGPIPPHDYWVPPAKPENWGEWDASVAEDNIQQGQWDGP
jgi:hypothetical protein